MTADPIVRFRLRLRLGRLHAGPLRAPRRDFHVLGRARDAYGLDDAWFSLRGDVVFADLYRSHEFAAAVNRVKSPPEHERLRASQANAMGLVHEVYHAVLDAYRRTVRPQAFSALLARLQASMGDGADEALLRFIGAYPPPAVHGGGLTSRQYLEASTGGTPNRAWVLEELLLVWLTNHNPAYEPIRELVTDEPLRADEGYRRIVESARSHFAEEPGFGPGEPDLLEMLLEPSRRHPDSLQAQIDYMRARWGLALQIPEEQLRLLLGLDFIREEGKWFLRRGHAGPPAAELAPRTFRGELYESEPEKFSPDLDWMPKVVMIAKSTFVWLDQLSKTHGRPVRLLSDIPDEELDELARRGFTALWLIGLWRRSEASRRVKQLCGNPEAAASAYSLRSYDVAPELGGWDAYRDLRDRCWKRGIRLASDMVPNHTGIDGDWMIEHPEWFIQAGRPPFPNYTFTGPDLSTDPRVGLFIEDGYWKRTDAAVVFKRVDRATGQERFVYHGNDGTSMPWNDTAQLDYLRADVREAVVRTILHVAKLFPIIRFDAAMTLAKRHYERLWFPQPGQGGDIPSRAAFAMERERFEELFPVEFWREVVDRVQAEAPETLLLAEAFWLMEGYFVRTLGMHRVYNSAFMNMLKREENAGFRTSMRNVLEFNPQILKRHVNFMNNPDEETAVAQFGRDDRYFGVCLMMCTMPGLPMFGHGQVDGFTEKYGMEYVKAYRDEQPDAALVDRHRREIFPLLKRRRLFAEVDHFRLYDFETPDGKVDEDVFAWSNRSGEDRALLLFHNRYKQTHGRVRTSVPFLGASGAMEHSSLAEGLGLSTDEGICSLFRDHPTGLEYVRVNRDLARDGFDAELGAFRHHAFVDWREVRASAEAPYDELARHLAGAGVPSVADALIELKYKAIHVPFLEAVNVGSAEWLLDGPHTVKAAAAATADSAAEEEAALAPIVAQSRRLPPPEVEEAFLRKARDLADGIASLHKGFEPDAATEDALLQRFRTAWEHADAAPSGPVAPWHFATALLFCDVLRTLRAGAAPESAPEAAVREWHADRVLARAFREAGASTDDAAETAELLAILAARSPVEGVSTALPALLLEPHVRAFLKVNVYEAVVWFDKERLDRLAGGLLLAAAFDATRFDAARATLEARSLSDLAEKAGFRLEPFIALLASAAPAAGGEKPHTRPEA